jgi:hypothetical protein
VAIGFVTFGIGWLVWALILFGRGQTPGKLLGMRTLRLVPAALAWCQARARHGSRGRHESVTRLSQAVGPAGWAVLGSRMRLGSHE